MELLAGERVGPYEIRALIGTGGMGQVYRAHDQRLGRDVAIKILPLLQASDRERLRRFEQEARAVAALNHPNVLSVHDVGVHRGTPYLVCELLEGETLRAQIARGPMPHRKVVELGAQAAQALAAAHEQGIIHRDLKPENLWVQRNGQLKILDFGLAKLRRGEVLSDVGRTATAAGAATQAGMILGTIGYMSPEQVRGQAADQRSDLFSLGTVLYEMLTGQAAFRRDSEIEIMTAVLREEPPEAPLTERKVPPALQRLVERCLQKEPAQRFQSASDLAFALEALGDESTPKKFSPKIATAEPEKEGTGERAEPAGSRRLESWKEIAAFLKRDVRTAKRWEKEEGLPVHRHLHKKLASVYAYESELEAWQRARKPRAEAGEAEAERARRLRRLLAVGAVAAVLALAAVAVLVHRPGSHSATSPAWVLIARFDNRTGEAVFDGTLEYALERELSNSRFVRVAPRERILDGLELMRKPPTTVVDREVAREIALRDGEIGAVISGRVDKLGTTYLLSADLVAPRSGQSLGGVSEEVRERDDVVGAIRRLSDRVREVLGERAGSITEGAAGLEKVSTPSLEALHLYSQADLAAREFQWSRAAALLQAAIEQDPEFASAHHLLGHALQNSGNREEARRHFERALQLSERSTEREKYFIRAGYYQYVQKDREKSTEALLALVQLYPDHYWAVSSLWFSLSSAGRPREALPYARQRAELRPGYFDHQLMVAHELLAWGDPSQAPAFLSRAQGLIPRLRPEDYRTDWRRARFQLYPAHEDWTKGDLEAAFQELEALQQRFSSPIERSQIPLGVEAAAHYLVLGKTAQARSLYERLQSGPRDYLALAALAAGDVEAARAHLQRARPSYRAAILLLHADQVEAAERMLSDPTALEPVYSPSLPNAWHTVVAGEIALARGEVDKAIPLLHAGSDLLRVEPTAYYFLAAASLAQAWERKGELARSLEVLEQASRYRRSAVFWDVAPVFWMKNELRRAALYRQTGRRTDANEVEADLRRLLALAGEDHFILRELQRRASD